MISWETLMPTRSLAFAAAMLVPLALPASAQQPGAEFPEGAGKQVVLETCGGCHDINRLKIGYTPEGWHTVMRMMQNMEAPIPADQVETVTQYLIKAFPERPRPAAKIIDGPVQVSIKQWPVATPGSRPHDPRATHDGSIWYTGQLAGVLGRLDPDTGQIKEFQLKTPHTGPHGLAEDKDGNIWFTGNRIGIIGKLDPKTGEVTEYPLPDPQAGDPHTLNFDQSGILWFTVQAGNSRRSARSEDRRDQAVHAADRERPPLRDHDQFQGHSGVRRVRHQQGGDHRPARPTLSRSTRCRMRPRARAASPSPRMTSSGTRTLPAATSAGSISRPAR